MRIFLDIETNMVSDWINLSDIRDLHCIVVWPDSAVAPYHITPSAFKKLAPRVTEIVGHNIMAFDLPALRKLLKKDPFPKSVKIVDTLLMSRLRFPDIANSDYQKINFGFPKELVGSHSLKAWGYRLNMAKGEHTDFSVCSPEMIEYCIQDVRITKRLFDHFDVPSIDPRAVAIEHRFAEIIREQEKHGFGFDVAAAEKLHAELLKEKLAIESMMREVFPDKVIERVSEKTGKKLKPVVEQFNPGSRLQIAQRLTEKYGWQPAELTGDGRPKVDESVLEKLDYPEAKFLVKYLTCTKRLGQLADGDNAWLKLQKNGKLHGRVNTNGAVTGRCTHSLPNMAQVPTDPAYRSLFVPPAGKVLVGADASGLELRCLAHFLGKYDGGDYARKVVSCDIHWENAKSFGLAPQQEQDKANPSHKQGRNQAKGGIYALIYGAADTKLGLVLGGDPKLGKKSRANFYAAVPAFQRLKDDVEKIVSLRNELKGIDGRPLPIRSPHAALNTLLQSAGAVIMKMACIIAHDDYRARGIKVDQVAAVHDEYQLVCDASDAALVGKTMVQSITKAGEYFMFRCPLDGEFRVGKNWAETH
jgi:DNA polymerase I-like protein with 3'-5' exonuclease and polymerase domains